jgi:hypothetical protein
MKSGHLFSWTGKRERSRSGLCGAVCKRRHRSLGFEDLEGRLLLSGLSGADWVRQHFADLGAPTRTGELAGRVTVNSPTLFDNAHVTGDKYGIDVLGSSFGVVNSTIEGQQPRPGDPTGASIRTRDGSSPTVGYLADVILNPGLPPWVGYSTTNFDGTDYDAQGPSSALYTLNVTVRDWADAALDIKAEKSQHVGLTVQAPPDGPGNRALRFWQAGPHYLVDSTIDGSPTLIWVSAAAHDDFELRVWKSTFAGQSTVPAGRAVWGDDNLPLPMERITYLDHDPRTTGEMHDMFAATDTTPPVISAVSSSNVTSDGATIQWSTDEPGTSQVEYRVKGTTTWSATSVDTVLVTNHSVALSGLTAETEYEFRVKSKDGSGNEAVQSTIGVFTTSAENSDAPFQMVDGQVVMEGESFFGTTTVNGQNWRVVDAPANIPLSGGKALMAAPDLGQRIDTNITTNSPRADFKFQADAAGTYYVWVRAYAQDGNSDSLHVGLDGALVSGGNRMSGFIFDGSAASWASTNMDGQRVSFTVSAAGEHTLNLWFREDGLRVDKVVITRNAAYVPTGLGPVESGRVTTDTTPPVISAVSSSNVTSGGAVSKRREFVARSAPKRVDPAIADLLFTSMANGTSHYRPILDLTANEFLGTEQEGDNPSRTRRTSSWTYRPSSSS